MCKIFSEHSRKNRKNATQNLKHAPNATHVPSAPFNPFPNLDEDVRLIEEIHFIPGILRAGRFPILCWDAPHSVIRQPPIKLKREQSFSKWRKLFNLTHCYTGPRLQEVPESRRERVCASSEPDDKRFVRFAPLFFCSLGGPQGLIYSQNTASDSLQVTVGFLNLLVLCSNLTQPSLKNGLTWLLITGCSLVLQLSVSVSPFWQWGCWRTPNNSRTNNVLGCGPSTQCARVPTPTSSVSHNSLFTQSVSSFLSPRHNRSIWSTGLSWPLWTNSFCQVCVGQDLQGKSWEKRVVKWRRFITPCKFVCQSTECPNSLCCLAVLFFSCFSRLLWKSTQKRSRDMCRSERRPLFVGLCVEYALQNFNKSKSDGFSAWRNTTVPFLSMENNEALLSRDKACLWNQTACLGNLWVSLEVPRRTEMVQNNNLHGKQSTSWLLHNLLPVLACRETCSPRVRNYHRESLPSETRTFNLGGRKQNRSCYFLVGFEARGNGNSGRTFWDCLGWGGGEYLKTKIFAS